MEYETSYDTGAKPFVHDKDRGKWESSKDFLYACIGHAFRPDIITIIPLVVFEALGIYALIPYFVILAVCVVPIVFIQSFLGQFSGTGFISVFRIAPLFKGIGYVSLIVNCVNLTYYSVFSAIPLFYIFHSLRPTIPWSCEGTSQWMNINKTVCTKNEFSGSRIPSVEFLRDHFHFTKGSYTVIYFSLELIVCTGIIWSLVTFVLLKSTEIVGRFM
ncbi:sodium-dependent proline transporter-like isoform X3 [Eupeodes corollae]|uniref:sodium-dependent proline transporter-like isoform X3 n=1 Tax=Eupeodes corollae TaxID=290404 RepID=UPI0024926C34|nr:sodium-dependent proline transporter-like isoform X3 [Eupeodes corollae]